MDEKPSDITAAVNDNGQQPYYHYYGENGTDYGTDYATSPHDFHSSNEKIAVVTAANSGGERSKSSGCYSPSGANSIIEEPPRAGERLQRKLKSRHLALIAIGGTIGTGLFVGSGNVLQNAGPAGALVAYIFIGSIVFFVCTSLGEVATFIPSSDPFNSLSSRILDEALGCAFGWNYWLSWALTVASEFVACGIVVQMWLPHVHTLVWSSIATVIVFAINSSSVSWYGEMEYWFSIIKILAVVVFIIVGILTDAGVLGGKKYAFENWTIPGAPFHKHIVGILQSCITAAFSFQGTEIIGVTVGESANPRKHVPRAIRSVFWRILLFYVLSIFVIGLIIPYNDSKVLSSNGVGDTAQSPFTIVFERAGLKWAASLMNAVVLITVLSAGNSGLYASTRVMWMLAKDRKAPAIFSRVNRFGVPFWAMLFTTFWAVVFFALSFIGDQVVYLFLVNISGVTGFIFWICITVCHIRFRRAYIRQGYSLDDLPYKAMFYPFGPYYATILLFVVMIAQGYSTLSPFSPRDFVSTYIAIPIFIIIWVTYKYWRKTKFIKLMDIDLVTDTLPEQERLGLIKYDPEEEQEGYIRYYTAWPRKLIKVVRKRRRRGEVSHDDNNESYDQRSGNTGDTFAEKHVVSV